jgi:hypothetical protein
MEEQVEDLLLQQDKDQEEEVELVQLELMQHHHLMHQDLEELD